MITFSRYKLNKMSNILVTDIKHRSFNVKVIHVNIQCILYMYITVNKPALP